MRITARAAAAWTRWRAATSPWELVLIMQSFGMSEAEGLALDRLLQNMDVAGPRATWFANGEPRRNLIDQLFDGLFVSPQAVKILSKWVDPSPWGRSRWVIAELEKRIPEENVAEKERRVTDSIREAIDTEKIDLTKPFPAEVSRRLAEELGTSKVTVRAIVSKIRKSRGVHLTPVIVDKNGKTIPVKTIPVPEASAREPQEEDEVETTAQFQNDFKKVAVEVISDMRGSIDPVPTNRDLDLTVSQVIVRQLLRIGLENVHPEELQAPLWELCVEVLRGER